MSSSTWRIALSIQPKGSGPEAGRVVPVATVDAFRKDWLPTAQALNLFWVPLFETGIPVSLEDLLDIVAEVKRLESWIEVHQPEVASRISKRLRDLISALDECRHDASVELYIG